MHRTLSRFTVLACAAFVCQVQAHAKDAPPPIKPGLW